MCPCPTFHRKVASDLVITKSNVLLLLCVIKDNLVYKVKTLEHIQEGYGITVTGIVYMDVKISNN